MILADYQAISHGLGSIAQARDYAEQQALQQAALKRQMERDASDEELRRAAIKIQEQQAIEAANDRRERLTADQQRLKMQLDQQAWSFDPKNPANQLHSAQVAHIGAQTAALQSKPQTPLGATTQGIDEFSAAMADAQEENAQALAFAQANPQHPEAGRRLAKAQLKLAGLQEFSKTMLQKWKPETDHTIDLELPGAPGADGVPEGKLRMKVPVSQWNDSHPMWSRFNAPAAAPVTGKFPPPPPAAIALLKSNPAMRAQFEAKYGPGSAAAALR